MALTNCPDCGTEVSDAAPNCPKCARPIAAKVEAASESTRPNGSEALGIIMMLAPLGSTFLIWFWVGSMNLLQGPGSSLTGLVVLTVLGTATLGAIEAGQLGAGKPAADGKRRTGPVGWFIGIALFWIACFPAWLFVRKRHGRRNLVAGGIVIALVFIFSAFAMGIAIEEQAAKIRSIF